MPKRVITEELKKEINRLKGTMPPKEISDRLGLNYVSVTYHLNGSSERRKVGKVREFKTPRCKKEMDKPGFFNVDAVENWLA